MKLSKADFRARNGQLMQRNSRAALKNKAPVSEQERTGQATVYEYLRPEIIAKISRFGFTKKSICEGSVSGRHSSPYRGSSSEFSAFRPYAQGDDIRYLDWKVYGRCERFYVRQFEQETNMRVCIVVDKSNSMDFCSTGSSTGRLRIAEPLRQGSAQPSRKGTSKADYAKILSSTLAYILIKRGDSASFAAVDSGVSDFVSGSRSSKNLAKILKRIAEINPSGKTDIPSALKIIGSKLKRRTLVVLISDMLTGTPEIIRTINNFVHQKHSFIVFQVLDPLEFNLPAGNRFLFIDKETAEKIPINVKKSAVIYRKQFGKFIEGIENSLRNCGAGYFRFNTGK
ncbi:MAG: DUF58 domain-containing protein, partial [bacterium]